MLSIGFLLQSSKCVSNVQSCLKTTGLHWEDPEGSGGEGGGRGDRDGEYMYIHGLFMSMYDKNHTK